MGTVPITLALPALFIVNGAALLLLNRFRLLFAERVERLVLVLKVTVARTGEVRHAR